MSVTDNQPIRFGDQKDRFNDDWLSLREAADHRSRAANLCAELSRLTPEAGWQILDLAAGQGSNTRYLAPRLPGSQHWTLIDHDPGLLAAAERRCRTLMSQTGNPVTVSTQRADLKDMASDWLPDVMTACNLVTASALIDLVSIIWLKRFAAWAAAHNLPVFVALSYSGKIRLNPAQDDDTWLQNQVNRHQLGDGPFGPGLGPSAPEALQRILQNLGYRVHLAPSDWQLSSQEAELQRALVHGWSGAVSELSTSDAEHATEWRRSAEQRIADGCDITVGHFDLLAFPPTA